MDERVTIHGNATVGGATVAGRDKNVLDRKEAKGNAMKNIEFWIGEWAMVRIFGLRIGVNLRGVFIIYNGKRHNWQIQSWPPRFAHWRSWLFEPDC